MRQTKQIAVSLVVALALMNTACPFGVSQPSDVEKVERKLDQAANGVNAIAKTARELYRQNVINLQERKLAGKIIEEINDGLEKVSDRAIEIDLNNPDSIKAGKLDVEALLKKAIETLNRFDGSNAQLRLAAQAVVLTINEALTLVRLVKEVRKNA